MKRKLKSPPFKSQYAPPKERFLGAYRLDLGGCWIWRVQDGERRYASFYANGKRHQAHRFSWELFNGPIPTGLHVLHKCDMPKCVNPEHLFVGTHTDNMRDMVKKGRGRAGNAAKTTCPKGHPYTHRNKRGRVCGVCIAESHARYHERCREARKHKEQNNGA